MFIVIFLSQEDKFREVREALRQSRIEWMKRGPANKRWEVRQTGCFSTIVVDYHA